MGGGGQGVFCFDGINHAGNKYLYEEHEQYRDECNEALEGICGIGLSGESRLECGWHRGRGMN